MSRPDSFLLQSALRLARASPLDHDADTPPELVDHGGAYMACMQLPGLWPDDIEVASRSRELLVRLRRPATGAPGSVRGALICRIETPTEICASEVRAVMRQGFLTITAPQCRCPPASPEPSRSWLPPAVSARFLYTGWRDGKIRPAGSSGTLADLVALAYHDDLTGLYNRRGFMRLGRSLLAAAATAGSPAMLFFVDLDHLKRINDVAGHRAGDAMLVSASRILRATFRRTDLLCRLGGDEFVILTSVPGDDDGSLILARLGRRLEQANCKGRHFPLTLSVGIARFDPFAPIALEDLLERADGSMYRERLKSRGGGRPPAANACETQVSAEMPGGASDISAQPMGATVCMATPVGYDSMPGEAERQR